MSSIYDNFDKTSKWLYLIIPTYNESENILKTLLDLPEIFDKIILVDDGSVDDTYIKLEKIESENRENIVLLNHEKNKGKGAAIKSGLKWIINRVNLDQDGIILFMDGDGQMDPDYISGFVNEVFENNTKYVKATRLKNKKHHNVMPKFRYFGNLMLKFLNKIATSLWNISDPQNGYFAISNDGLNKIEINNLADDYFFENSMLFEIGRIRKKIVEIEIPAIYGGGEKSSIVYHKFIPKTALKLLYGYVKRVWETRKINKLRSFNFILNALGFLILLMGIIYEIIGMGGTRLSILGIVSFASAFILDYKDFKTYED